MAGGPRRACRPVGGELTKGKAVKAANKDEHSSQLLCGGRLTVNLDALAANFAALAGLAAPSRCAGVVKANAYGLGLEPVARRLAVEGCDIFFVATLGEGLQLRTTLPNAEIYVLEGPWPAEVAIFHEARLSPVINTLEQYEHWARQGAAQPFALQLDTGMSRLGLRPADARELGRRLPADMKPEYLLTHLACADEPGHAVTPAQLALFDDLCQVFPGVPTSLGNTAGIAAGPSTRGSLVRAGIGLYGGNPLPDGAARMLPVAMLEGRVLQLREVPDGTHVGYGARFRARGPARLATLGVGYADGYPRSLGNRGYGVLHGHRLPVVGRVSMDSLVIDITRLPADALKCGDLVQLLGPDVNVDELAGLAGTISYELLTGLGPRLERRYAGAV